MTKAQIPTIMVILGATGDLMTKKIVPALHLLYQQGKLPKLFHVLGVARRPWSTPDFHTHIRSIVNSKGARDELTDFLTHFSYERGEFATAADYTRLAQSLGQIDGQWRVCANKLFYLAVPPEYFETILTHLAASGLTKPCSPQEGWTRVIVEKPFGKDLVTAKRLDARLAELFREEQIYRLDHYLAKEMLQNILTFRFSNNLLEESWNNRFIEKIEIRLHETIGVEDRGAFYDGVGALRDVGQNHLLQMLALVTMDHPKDFTAEAIRAKRAAILGTLRELSSHEVIHHSVRGQYRGYQAIKGVEPRSTTETYFYLETFLDQPRWQGVPIHLEAGKRMGKVQKEIVVTFKHPRPCLCPASGEHLTNRVRFALEPVEGITIDFWAKKPGLTFDIEPRAFDFALYPKSARTQYVEEYGKLLLDCISGDQTLFVSTEEIREMWRGVDPVIETWQTGKVPLPTYQPDTNEAVHLGAAARAAPDRVSLARRPVGMVGLGKMGAGLVRQLLEKGWPVVGYNRTSEAIDRLAQEGMVASSSLQDLVAKLPGPRVIWLMVPSVAKASAGKPTRAAIDDVLDELLPFLASGDIIIDGGNSYFEETVKRGRRCGRRGVKFIDIGVSGGPSGARTGAALMIGGEAAVYRELEPLFRDLAAPGGYQFFPGLGAGHFVKMIHNGIEYGMMQALAEGFEILQTASYRLDLERVAHVYNHGSVIDSRLVGWLTDAFELHGPDLEGVTSTVAHTGEGAWTVTTAKKLGVEAKIIAGALAFRQQSAKNPRFAGKVLSALREQFGGHASR